MTNLNIGIQKTNIIDTDYNRYLEYLRSRGYYREQICIDETYTDVITTRSLAEGAVGTVIDIRCPSRYKMVIVGSSQLPEGYNIEGASSLMVRLADSKNVEIDPDVRIKILKEKVSQSITLIDTMFYKDISATDYMKISPNKTKSLETNGRYIFGKGVEINGDEHLKIDVAQPNIGIDCKNVRLSLNLDLWEQE